MAIDAFELEPNADPLNVTWRPSPLLLTPADTLQGGAGLGAALAAMQTATGRPVIWATAQYLTYAVGMDPIDIAVTIEVTGRNTTQARCVLSRDGDEILTAHAALGTREFELEGVWVAPPEVPAPDECSPYRFFARGRGHLGDRAEFRLALGRQLDDIERDGGRGNGSFALWVRCWDGTQPTTVSDLAFVGDFMPLGFADATGHPYAGNSLDNTIRVGNLVDTEWILLSTHVQQVANGFGYGRAELWSDDRTLLGEVSQSAILRKYSRMREVRAEPTPDPPGS
jgi:acyl-CoA thioesterase